MELVGEIKIINETQTFGEKGFRKREMVLMMDGQYPQPVLIEFVQDKVDLLDKHQVGEMVTIHINIRGREWTNPDGVVKYFNSIQGWRIVGGGATATPTGPVTSETEPDDLPF